MIAPNDSAIVLCGHVHPAVRLGVGHEKIRLPCFWHAQGTMVLPAIGDFTGTEIICPKTTDQVWALVDENIVELSTKKA